MIINIDRKNRSINLSIKAKDHADETEAMQKMTRGERGRQHGHHQPRRPAARPSWTTRPTSKRAVVMTKSELIDRLAARFPQLVAKDAELAVKMILDAMAESLAKGERIEIRGFGSFGLNYRPPRTGRNPKSGEKVQVPEKHVPHFKAGKELRERVDFNEAAVDAVEGMTPIRAGGEAAPCAGRRAARSPSVQGVADAAAALDRRSHCCSWRCCSCRCRTPIRSRSSSTSSGAGRRRWSSCC